MEKFAKKPTIFFPPRWNFMNFCSIQFLKNTKNIYTFWNVHFSGLCFLLVRSRIPYWLIQNPSWFGLWPNNEKICFFSSEFLCGHIVMNFCLFQYVVSLNHICTFWNVHFLGSCSLLVRSRVSHCTGTYRILFVIISDGMGCPPSQHVRNYRLLWLRTFSYCFQPFFYTVQCGTWQTHSPISLDGSPFRGSVTGRSLLIEDIHIVNLRFRSQ